MGSQAEITRPAANGLQVIRPRPFNELMLMTRPPEDAAERQEIGDQMWIGLMGHFRQSLPAVDRKLWDGYPQDRRKCSQQQQRLASAFDVFLLEQFGTYWGWRLLTSRSALARLAEWEQDSPHLYRRLGEALELKSKVSRGEKSFPILPGLRDLKKKITPELRLLLATMRSNFKMRHRLPSLKDIAKWTEEELKADAGAFPLLHQNLPQLLGFIKNLKSLDARAATRLTCGKLPPTEFFYRFYAAASNRTYQSLMREMFERR